MSPADTDPESLLLSAAIALYLARCRVEAKSPRTVRAYAESLGRFQRLLAAAGVPDDLAGIGPAEVIGYLDHFTHLALETRHRYFREVRAFFAWCVRAGLLPVTPFRGLRNVRLPQRIVQPFTAAEVSRLLAACDPVRPIGQRNRAMVVTLLDTGLRCSELVGLGWEDWDRDRGRLWVRHGKGNRQRVVPVGLHSGAALAAYAAVRGAAPGPLFCAASGHGRLRPGVALQPNGLKQVLRRLGRETGIPRVHAHRFRHTFATWAIEQDARELDVQHLLGHAGPEMVRRYTSSYRAEQAAQRHVHFSPAARVFALTGSAPASAARTPAG